MSSLFIILMGVQGSGKGVQASFIRQRYGGIPHVSTGDLFRAMRTRQDDFAKHIQQIMAEGKLISDEITCQVVEERLALPDAQNGVIFDGFPRTIPQAEWLQQHLASKGQKIGAVLVMQLDLYEAFRRAFGRVTTAGGESFNIYSNSAGIDWKWVDHPDAKTNPNEAHPARLEAHLKSTGERLIRRLDDANAHAIIKRFDAYLAETKPLIPFYAAQGVVHEIDAAQPIEAVSAAIQTVLDQVQRSA